MSSEPESAANVPPPPGLHWLLVLILSIVTAGIFCGIWIIVQCLWAKKFDGTSRALYLYLIGIALQIPYVLVQENPTTRFPVPLAVLAGFASLACVLFAYFRVRDALAVYITEITGAPAFLSGLMTIFFGPIYLQYHMYRVRQIQRHLGEAVVA